MEREWVALENGVPFAVAPDRESAKAACKARTSGLLLWIMYARDPRDEETADLFETAGGRFSLMLLPVFRVP